MYDAASACLQGPGAHQGYRVEWDSDSESAARVVPVVVFGVVSSGPLNAIRRR